MELFKDLLFSFKASGGLCSAAQVRCSARPLRSHLLPPAACFHQLPDVPRPHAQQEEDAQ